MLIKILSVVSALAGVAVQILELAEERKQR